MEHERVQVKDAIVASLQAQAVIAEQVETADVLTVAGEVSDPREPPPQEG